MVYALAMGLILACAASASASAFGAIAFGVTTNGVTDGWALGTSYGYPTQNQANQRALTECRTYEDSPEAAKQCKILDTFHDQCYATAADKRAGPYWNRLGHSQQGKRGGRTRASGLQIIGRRPCGLLRGHRLELRRSVTREAQCGGGRVARPAALTWRQRPRGRWRSKRQASGSARRFWLQCSDVE